jgi:hypothetical protein
VPEGPSSYTVASALVRHGFVLAGQRGSNALREWRVLYVIDDQGRRTLVKAIGHRRTDETPEPPSSLLTTGTDN